MKIFQLIFVVAAVSLAITSCKKETISNPVTPVVPVTPVSKIEAVLKFDGNMSDSTGKLTAVSAGSVSYATDRKGNANSAVYFDGASKITYPNLNIKGNAFTMSAWVKYFNGGGGLQIVMHAINNSGPALTMTSGIPGVSISTPSTNSAQGSNVDNQWHHIAFTYDGNDIKLYVDGSLAGTTNHPGTMGDVKNDFVIGFFNNNYWKGWIDDVRVYSEVKTVADIQNFSAQ